MHHAFLIPMLIVLNLALVPAGWGETPAATTGEQLLTLDEAMRLARDNNRELRIKALNVEKAGEQVSQVRTKYLPKLDTYLLAGTLLESLKFTIPAGSLGTYPGLGALPSQDSAIRTPRQFSALVYASAAQPLTQLYKVSLAEQQARLGADLASEDKRAEWHDLRLKIEDGYWRVAQLQAQVESAAADARYLAELSRLTDQRLSVRTVLASDALTVKARLKQQRYLVLTLEDALALQKQSLNHLLGRPLLTRFSVEIMPVPGEPRLDLEAARKQALERRPELREARLQTEMARTEIKRERAEYIPDISLQVGYLSFPNVSFMPQNVWHAGLLFQWQPFDWGYKKHRIAEFSANTRQKTLSEQDAGERILLDVEDKFRKTGRSRMLVEAQADARDAERAKLREITDRYAQQAALLSDVLRQQAALAQAESQYQQALAGFWTARAEFDKATGEE